MEVTMSVNQQFALWVMQALLGVVSRNFRFVSVETASDRVRIRIVLEHHDEGDYEEIEDFKTEFEALLPGPIAFDVEVVESDADIEWPDPNTTVVFKRRE